MVADMVAKFQERRDYVVKRLQAMGQFDVVEPTGAFYILPDIATLLSKGPYTDDFGSISSSDEFVKYLIEKANVATVPGDAFGAPTCIRISYAASMETLKEAMDRIETSVKNLQYKNA